MNAMHSFPNVLELLDLGLQSACEDKLWWLHYGSWSF